jgi:hypothetical protein
MEDHRSGPARLKLAGGGQHAVAVLRAGHGAPGGALRLDLVQEQVIDLRQGGFHRLPEFGRVGRDKIDAGQQPGGELRAMGITRGLQITDPDQTFRALPGSVAAVARGCSPCSRSTGRRGRRGVSSPRILSIAPLRAPSRCGTMPAPAL